MGLSSRREKVLRAVVDTYINTCEPISSAEIQENYLQDVSSATIRNELSILEDMGYLTQPHTSAGRIPTAEGYRLYVEKLMPKRKVTRAELKIIKRYFNKKVSDIDYIVRNTAKIISEITNLTGVAYVKNSNDAVIENIKIVKINDKNALFIIVTDKSVMSDSIVSIPEEVSEQYLDSASDFASKAFSGFTLEEAVRPGFVAKQVRRDYEEVFKTIIKIIKKYSFEDNPGELILEGSSKLLAQPEYANVGKAKAMLELLDAKEQLYPILQSDNDMQFNIKIGRDVELKDGMPECAIVTVSCNINGKQIGNAGVIGPMRMDYPKVISVLDYIGKTINSLPDSSPDEDPDEEEIISTGGKDG